MKSTPKTLGEMLVLLGLVMLLPVSAKTQQVVPLRVEDVLSIREFGAFSPAQFSPDGQWVLYTARDNRGAGTEDLSEYARTGVFPNAKGQDICIVKTTGTHETLTLTGGKGANWFPAWSPNGRYVAFLSDRDGSGQAKLWVWEAATNELRKVSDVAVRARKIEWMSSSDAVLTTILPEDLTAEEYANRILPSGKPTHEQKVAIPGSTVIVYKADFVRQRGGATASSDPWSLEEYLGDLALLDIKTASVHRLVRDKRIGEYIPSPNGSYVAFTSPTRFERPGSQQILWDLSFVTISDDQVKGVASDVHFDYDGASFSWSPESSSLAYLTGGPLETTTGAADCYLVDLKGGTPRNITRFRQQGIPYKQSSPLWDNSREFIYILRHGSIWKASLREGKALELAAIPNHDVKEFVVEDKNRLWSPDGGKSTVVLTFDREARQSGFYQITLDKGEATRLLEDAQCHTCVNVAAHISARPGGSELAYFSEDSQHSDDLWLAVSSFHSLRRLTHLNPQLDKHQMSEVQLVEWRSLDGDRLRGSLLLPLDYQKGKHYPLVVWVYGGDRGSDHLNHFGLMSAGALNLQLLAARGYAVLFPDAPQHLGTPMADLAKAVLPGVDRVIEMGVADPERLGVMGHSYGGYSALSLIVQTKRFKAAVMVDGLGDLIASYGEMSRDGTAFGTSGAEQGQELMGGTPWLFRDRYIENSPIFFLDRVETPLLIIHGGEDRVVAPFLGDEVFVGLRRLGKEVEYAKYDGEGHSPIYWSYANQIDFCSRTLSWFDRFLSDKKETK